MSDDIVTRLREDFCDFGQWENSCTPEGKCPCCLAADEIERLRLESLQLQGLVRAHEGMYVRAAEQIDQQRNWLERLYRLTVGHGPNWGVFDSWEDAITAYEETRCD
jgi:hypothetical protein